MNPKIELNHISSHEPTNYVYYLTIFNQSMIKPFIKSRNHRIYRSLLSVHPIYTRASGSHRCVGTLEAPTSYGNNRLCLRAVDARKLVEILIKGAILSAADCGSKYELHPRCSRLFYIR